MFFVGHKSNNRAPLRFRSEVAPSNRNIPIRTESPIGADVKTLNLSWNVYHVGNSCPLSAGWRTLQTQKRSGQSPSVTGRCHSTATWEEPTWKPKARSTSQVWCIILSSSYLGLICRSQQWKFPVQKCSYVLSVILSVGVGDFQVAEVNFLPDPCPLPDAQKKRALNEKERLLYAPMAGVGGLVYDKDAVYIDLPANHVNQQQVSMRNEWV